MLMRVQGQGDSVRPIRGLTGVSVWPLGFRKTLKP